MSSIHRSGVSSLIANVFTLIGLIAVMILIVSVTLSTPYLTNSGPLSPQSHTVMIVGITILATIFSLTVTSRVRHLLLRNINVALTDMARNPDLANTDTEEFKRLDRRWRGILSIDSASEKGHNLSVVLAYAFCALITTAIVTTFTPVSIVRTIEYHPVVPDANYGFNQTCVYMVDEDFGDERSYSWKLSNGSVFFVPANAGGCPTRYALYLSENINTINPSAYAYADQGVAVEPAAIGAPISIYSSQPNVSQALDGLLTDFGTYLLNTSQCVPVMSKNPIQCKPGGSLIINSANGQNSLTAISADGSCNGTLPFYFNNVTTDNVMWNFMCTGSGDDSIGKGTMVLSGTASYGALLASAINDRGGAPETLPHEYTYTVTCDVNTQDVFSYRTVTLGLQGAENVSQSSYGRVLSSSGECTPVEPVISNILFATAAAANWQLLSQNIGADGYFDMLSLIAGNWRQPPYAFPNSQNGLEDALGLVSAMVASRVNNSGRFVPAEATAQGRYGGASAQVLATRLGTGKKEALLLLIAPVGSALILGYLILRSCSVSGLGLNERRVSDTFAADARYRYAESIRELMLLGGLLDSSRSTATLGEVHK